jgi:hypothetical protein
MEAGFQKVCTSWIFQAAIITREQRSRKKNRSLLVIISVGLPGFTGGPFFLSGTIVFYPIFQN